MSGPSPWNTERDEQLADFWGDGLTTSEIGRRMGISKNATNPPPATWLKNRGMLWARG